MQDTIEQLLSYVYGIWRYRWTVMIVAWVIGPIGWVVVSKIPNQYESTAQVYIDTDTILRPLLKGLSVDSLDPNQRFSLMAKELLSRPNLEYISREVDLDVQAVTVSQKEKLLQALKKNINIGVSKAQKSNRRGQPNLYKISAQNKDPEKAYRIVQALLDTFVEGALSGKRAENIAAQKFIGNEIKKYDLRLVAAETRLRKFRRRNIRLLPEQGSSYYQRLQSARNELESVELDLNEQEHRRDELLRQLKNTSQMQQIVTEDGATVLSPIDQRIVAMQKKLDNLLLTYTDQHPDVSEARSILKELKATKQKELNTAKNNTAMRIQNPLYQQVHLALGKVEANIAATQVREKEYKKRVKRLQQQIKTLPKVEAELQALNRDYDVNRKNYDSLVARREAARMGASAEQTGQQVKIKIIEPPIIPAIPTSPNRLMLSTLVLLVAFGAGAGIAFLWSQFRHIFYNQSSIREVLGLPVFGTVSYFAQPQEIIKGRLSLTGYIVTGVGLVLAYFGVLYSIVA